MPPLRAPPPRAGSTSLRWLPLPLLQSFAREATPRRRESSHRRSSRPRRPLRPACRPQPLPPESIGRSSGRFHRNGPGQSIRLQRLQNLAPQVHSVGLGSNRHRQAPLLGLLSQPLEQALDRALHRYRAPRRNPPSPATDRNPGPPDSVCPSGLRLPLLARTRGPTPREKSEPTPGRSPRRAPQDRLPPLAHRPAAHPGGSPHRYP